MEMEMREPCHSICDVEWCSLECFYRRGYMRQNGKWVRDDKGNILISNNRQCDWVVNHGTEKETV